MDDHHLIYLRSNNFLTGEISPENEINYFLNKDWFWRFSVPKSEKKKEWKSTNLHIWVFICSQKSKRRMNFFTFFLVYSQVWLNLPRDDHHFLWIKATLATKQCFFYWRIFAKFWPEKYDFYQYKGSFMEKNDLNSPDFREIFQIARFLW